MITEKRENVREQEKIDLDASCEKIQKLGAVEDKPRKDKNLESFVEILAEDVVVPKVQQYPYFSHNVTDDEQIRRIVKETLKDQLPYIISQVKDALLKELKPAQPLVIERIEERIEQEPVQSPVIEKIEEKVEEKIEENVEEEVPQNVLEEPEMKEESEEMVQLVEKVPERKQSNSFVDKVRNFFGKNLKAQIVELPGKAKDAIDDWSQKIEGDPLVQCEEGRFPKSVVEKATQLHEIFPEEERKSLLELVSRCPRYATLTQLADYYMRKGEPQQEDPERVEENDENVAEDDNEKEKEYAC